MLSSREGSKGGLTRMVISISWMITVALVVVLLVVLALALIVKRQSISLGTAVLILAYLCFVGAVAGWPIFPLVPLGLALWVLSSLI